MVRAFAHGMIGRRIDRSCGGPIELYVMIYSVSSSLLKCNCVRRQIKAGHSSEVERSLMVRWVVGSILHGVNPLSYFSFQPMLHDCCNKGRGIYYPVCGMMHIKEPFAANRKE